MANPEDVSPSQFAGVIGVTLGNPRKPWRHMHHDYQPIDEVRIVTVPRYKTSGLSGDEWRVSAKIQCFRKGLLIYERSTLNVESAIRYLDTWLMQAGEEGKLAVPKELVHLCDQEGCAEVATITYRLKKEYDRRSGTPRDPHSVMIQRFCDRHKVRGDCGLEDADVNYEVVKLKDDGMIEETQ